MSLLSTVEQAIKSCKTEQAVINDRIQLYREILHALTSPPKIWYEESDSAADVTTGTDTTQGEKEDIELLERALEKALHVRTSTGPSKQHSNKHSAPQKEPGTSDVTSKQASAAKGNQTTTRLTSKSARFDRIEHKRPGVSVTSTLGAKSSASYNRGQCKAMVNRNILPNCPVSSTWTLHYQAARKSQQSISTSGSLDPDRLHLSTLHAKRRIIRSNVLSGNDLGKATAISKPSPNNTAPVLHTGGSGAHRSPQQNRIAPDQTAKWKSLRRKQNRLWDKVTALQRKPVLGRSHFMERMRAVFPEDWPSGSPDQTRALVDSLTQQGHDLTHRCQTKEILAKETSEASTELGLQMTAAELQNLAVQVKQDLKNQDDARDDIMSPCLTLITQLCLNSHVWVLEYHSLSAYRWDAWDRWRPEGGCLCPTEASGVWGDGMIAPLPPTITYTAEAELKEVERLRMRVALLQQEMHLDQALLDTLSPQLSSIAPEHECPNVSVLRDMYSLLGEGGQHFPALVLDSEPD